MRMVLVFVELFFVRGSFGPQVLRRCFHPIKDFDMSPHMSPIQASHTENNMVEYDMHASMYIYVCMFA